MQMTIDQARQPGLLLAFANRHSRGYMMRSERRSGYSAGGGHRKPPRKRRTSFLYIFFTLLVSLVLWPLGMVMLWRKKVRLQPGTKLLLSMMTLCISIFLIVFTLTVPVNNPEFTAFQDKTNDVLDRAAAKIAVAGDAAYRKGVRTWHVMEDFGDAAVSYSAKHVADGLDKGVEISQDVKARVSELLKHDTSDAPTDVTPAATLANETAVTPPTAEASAEPKETPSSEIEDDGTKDDAAEDGTPEATEEADTDTATPAPDATPEAATHDALNLDLPGEAPDPSAGTPLSNGTLLAGGAFVAGEEEADEAGDETPAGTEAPETTPSALSTQTAEESATAAPEGEADEAAGETPEATEEADAEENPEAADSAAEVTPEATEPAAEEPPEAAEETPEATEPAAEETPEAAEETPDATEPAAEETPEATVTPAPTELPPMTVTVKPAGDATVYFYNGGKAYHRKGCKTIGDDAPQHTLAEAIEAGKRVCGSCNPLSTNIMDAEHVAWVDANHIIHTTDECPRFKGEWTLISLENALESGYTPCPDCQADRYAATVARDGAVEAGAEATPEPTEAPEALAPETAEPVETPEATPEVVPADTPVPDPADDTVAEPLLQAADESAETESDDAAEDGPIADSWTTEEELAETPEPGSTIALKPAGDATLYHTDNGKYYHRRSACTGMSGGSAYRFAECVEQGYKQCPNCPAPAPEMVNIPCMWMDADGTCHTADTCAAFVGDWTLIPREDAMARKMTGCPACGGDRFLAPRTSGN